MGAVSIIKLKVRRGSDSDRKQVIFDQGEPVFITDPSSYRLFIGDGITYGGNPAAIKLYFGNIASPTGLLTTQIGDIVYNTNDTKLYSLTGVNGSGFPDYANPAAYAFIGANTDNQTIIYNGSGALSVNNIGISAVHVSSSVFSFTNGFTRSTSTGPIQVNYDNKTIVTSGSANALTVNFANLNPNVLPTTNPGPGKLWNNSGVISAGF